MARVHSGNGQGAGVAGRRRGHSLDIQAKHMEQVKPVPAFVCPRCTRASSNNPADGRERYCGNCHWWTGDPDMSCPHGVPRYEPCPTCALLATYELVDGIIAKRNKPDST